VFLPHAYWRSLHKTGTAAVKSIAFEKVPSMWHDIRHRSREEFRVMLDPIALPCGQWIEPVHGNRYFMRPVGRVMVIAQQRGPRGMQAMLESRATCGRTSPFAPMGFHDRTPAQGACGSIWMHIRKKLYALTR